MDMEKIDPLHALLAARPQTLAVVDAVLRAWPEHAAYLAKNFSLRSQAMLDATEAAAAACRNLIRGQEDIFAADYRWTCDRLREEEIFFHREGRYRLSTFAEANAEVYSRHDYMERYVHGLLLSQILWYNHIATFEMFLNRLLGAISRPFDYLEVGPGHGLMVFFAAQSRWARNLEAWDVSAVSLRETEAALNTLNIAKSVTLAEVNILTAAPPRRKFDLIVISEVLEHLEDPGAALRFLRQILSPDGKIFINVPINSPSPDHIYLLSSPDEVKALIESAGFEILQTELFATQGRAVESALASRISVSAGVIARLGSGTGRRA
jgi:2-polyprenyl-3-methyl-5-hydroxy-6-metoxy-1,4-benzoquinol methylase